METDIGPTLREARIRHKIDLTEIEERTKIRVRYLRALENEEWDVLPGPTYTRSFIRTYALALGLDGERLADDFRRLQEEGAAEAAGGREPSGLPPRLAPTGERPPRFGAGTIGGIAAAALIAVVIVLSLIGGEDEGSSPDGVANRPANQAKSNQQGQARGEERVSIRLTATAEVWVCAVAADGTEVVNGEILAPGAQVGPFRSKRFDLAFGNGGVDFEVDGEPFRVEETPSPVGYRVTTKRVDVLAEGTRPDCT